MPRFFDSAHKVPKCFLWKPTLTADCSPPLVRSERLVESGTYMGRYPPAYYFVVGLPSRVAVSPFGMHLMRLVSAAVAAALLASALGTARADGTGALLLGLALAVTPMVLFLAGSVNPNGLEIAAAIGWWISLLALLRGGTTASVRVLAVRAAVAGSVLANSRQLGPFWIVAILVVVVLSAHANSLGALARHPSVRKPAVAVAVFTALALAWDVSLRAYAGFGAPRGPDLSTARFVQASLGRTSDNLLQMVGVFGWTDTRAPLFTYAVWLTGLAAALILALRSAKRREMAALVGLVALVIVVPVVGETSQRIGFYWLGRYTLPLAVGVPLLAAELARPRLARLGTWLAVPIGVLVAAHVLAYAWAVRRFSVGVGRWGPVAWQPPLPGVVLVAAFMIATTLYWRRLTGPTPRRMGRVLEQSEAAVGSLPPVTCPPQVWMLRE